MEKASFSFKNYRFEKALIDLKDLSMDSSVDFQFLPKGIYNKDTGVFCLYLNFIANADNGYNKKEIINIECYAEFEFNAALSLEEIPSYFYPNSIAILFPYVRSFISTITLQANMPAIILPTMNLTNLQNKLKENTTVSENYAE